jgi:hypothetical protein
MNKLVVNVVVAAGLAVLSLPSFAAAPMAPHHNYYVGGGVNHNSTFKEHHAYDDMEDGSPVIRLDDNDWGWNIFAGERKDHFAHELGINKIGGVMYDIYSNGSKHDFFEVRDTYHFYYDGYLFKQVTSGLELFVKFGISYLELEGNRVEEGSQQLTVGYSPKNMHESDLSTLALNYGVGLQYNWKQFGLRTQYTHIAPTKDVENWNRIVDFVSIDGLYHIG